MHYNMPALTPVEHMAASELKISRSKMIISRGIRPISNNPICLGFAPKSAKTIQKHSNIHN